jgi:hypothetical protein
MRVSRVVAERPASRHSRTLSDYPNAIGIEILNGSGRAGVASGRSAATSAPRSRGRARHANPVGDRHPASPQSADVCDTGPWNIIATNGYPQAFIDWEFAGPVDPLWELAETTWLNAQLHDDDIAELHGLPDAATRARHARAIIDGYGLARADREDLCDRLLDVAVHSARAEVLLHGVTADSTTAVADDGYPILWGIAWRARSASWIARNRQLLHRALT